MKDYIYRGYEIKPIDLHNLGIYGTDGELICRVSTHKDAEESIDYWIDGSSR